MNRGILITLIVVILVVIGGGIYLMVGNNVKDSTGSGSSPPGPPELPNFPSQDSGAKEYSVDISGFSFSPSTLSIRAGESVKWTNMDSAPHTVTSDSGSELDSETLSKNEVYTHRFANPGTYNYYCTLHPGMKAKIIVS